MLRLSLESAAAVVLCLLFPQQSAQPPSSAGTTPTKRQHVKIATIPARPEDVSSIDGIIKAYYEVVSGPAGQPRQWDRDHTLYIPEVRFVLFTETKDGSLTARSTTHQEFADDTETALGNQAFYEHEVHRIVHRFGNAAHVLSTAEQSKSPNGPSTGHSIDSLELFWDGHRWWIASANIWPGDRPGRPLTPEFLP